MKFRSTTILTVRHKGKVAIGGDGQVTLGNTIMKADANKIRRLRDGNVLCGFAGSSADAFALLERFEAKLKDNPGQRAAGGDGAGQGMADRPGPAAAGGPDGRGRRQAHALLVSGTGDVIQPTDGIIGHRLRRAARRRGGPGVWWPIRTLSAGDIVREALENRRRHRHLHQPEHRRWRRLSVRELTAPAERLTACAAKI